MFIFQSYIIVIAGESIYNKGSTYIRRLAECNHFSNYIALLTDIQVLDQSPDSNLQDQD